MALIDELKRLTPEMPQLKNASSLMNAVENTTQKLEADVEQAVTVAKVYTATALALQAIAAFAALGIFVIQARAYGDSQRKIRVANNPRRRRRK